MTTIRNFSQNQFSSDQRAALTWIFRGADLEEPDASFFKGAEDFASRVSGTTASVVVPTEILMDALSEGLLEDGTILITWRADEAARKRGRFVAVGIAAYRLKGGRLEKSLSLSLAPTVEVDFKDGTEYPYYDS